VTLVALGDSITRGRGMAPAYGADPRSWAAWLAEAMELPFLNLASDGAGAAGVRREQLPRVPDCAVATLYVGVNDARRPDFDAAAFEDDVRALFAGLRERARRVAVLTIPLDLGRPRAGEDVVTANALLRSLGGEVVSLEDFGGWRHVLPDAVHPTALGQVEIAMRAARALGAGPIDTDAHRSLRGDLRFAPFYARQLAKDHLRRHREKKGVRPL
jgi:lysophospholipase L1-like esterase